jgi:hypothetical protein
MKTSTSPTRLLFLSLALLTHHSFSHAEDSPKHMDVVPEPAQPPLGASPSPAPAAPATAVMEEITPVVELDGSSSLFEPPSMMNASERIGLIQQPGNVTRPPLLVGALEAGVAAKASIEARAEQNTRLRALEDRLSELAAHDRPLAVDEFLKSRDERLIRLPVPRPRTGNDVTAYDRAMLNFAAKLDSLSVLKDGLRRALEKLPSNKISSWQKLSASLKLDRILNDPSLKSAQLVNVNLEALADSSVMDAQVKLCNGVQTFCSTAKTKGWTESSPTVQRMFVTLAPKTPADPVGSVLFVKSDVASIGVLTMGASTFTITPLADEVSVVTDSAATALERNLDDVATYSAQGGSVNGAAALVAAPAISNDSDCPNPKERQTVDLLVAFTDKAVDAALADGQDWSILSSLAQELSNLSFEQSDINGQVKIVKRIRTDYVETGNYKRDVVELTKPTGTLRKVQDERKKIKADVTVLVVDNADPRNCGIAAAIGATKENANVVVNWRCLTNRFSFIHEIGHLAGAWHDPDTLGTGYTVSPPYASGYVTGGEHPMATIMAYTSACPKPCGRGYFWANPFKKSPYGDPLGTVGKNFDACVWRKRLETMAKFDGG